MLHRRIVLDGVLGRWSGIGPPMVDQQLSATRFEFRQIRIDRIDIADFLEGKRKIHIQFEIHTIPTCVFMREAERVQRYDRWSAVGLRHAPTGFKSWRRSGV